MNRDQIIRADTPREAVDIALTNRAGLVFANGTVTMSVALLDTLFGWAREQAIATIEPKEPTNG